MGFDADGSFVLNKLTGKYNAIEDDGVNYLMKQWIVPPDQLLALMEQTAHAHETGFRGQAS